MIRTTTKGAVAEQERVATSRHRAFARVPTLFTGMALILFSITSCDESASITQVDDSGPDLSLASIDVMSGNEQEAEVGSPAPAPLVVRVTDQNGAALPDVPLQWTFTQGSGKSGTTSGTASEVIRVTTDHEGISRVHWELGEAAGRQEVTVGIILPEAYGGTADTSTATAGAPAWTRLLRFWAQAWPGTPAAVVVSPDTVHAVAGQTVQLQAAVSDRFGNEIQDAGIIWSSSDESVAIVDGGGAVEAAGEGLAEITAEAGSATGSALLMTEAGEPGLAAPAVVEDLEVVGSNETSVTLRWSQVDDGAGDPASYAVRLGTPELVWWEASGTEVVITGEGVGASMVHTWVGLEPGTEYEFRMVAFRGQLNAGAVFGDLSPEVSAATESAAEPTPATDSVVTIVATPSSRTFTVGQGDQIAATGLDRNGDAVADAEFTFESTDTSIVSVDEMGRMTARAVGAASIIVSAVCCDASTPIDVVVEQPSENAPERVTDLEASWATTTSITLEWTQVDNGLGAPANYAIRYGSPSVSWGGAYGSETLVDGNTVGATGRHTFDGLESGREYEFQLVSYRGTLNDTVSFGELSNVASATTDPNASPVVSVTTTPSQRTFTSIGQTAQITPIAYDATGGMVQAAEFVFESSDPSVVSVDDMGRMTANALGTAAILVSAACCSAEASVQVAVEEGGAPPSSGEPYFEDDFDNGRRNDSNGFSWSGGNNAPVSTDIAHSGSHSLKFSFGPTEPDGDSHWWTEQRFSLGRQVTELWVEYWIYYPDGTEGFAGAAMDHRSSNPSNNKFFRLWGGGHGAYSGNNNKVGMSTFSGGDIAFEYTADGRDGTGRFNGPGYERWETLNRGEWVQVRMHYRHVSAPGADDGRFTLWRDGEVWVDFRNVDQDYSSQPYWDSGYLLGYDNSGFNRTTHIYIDSVKFYTTNPGW